MGKYVKMRNKKGRKEQAFIPLPKTFFSDALAENLSQCTVREMS